MAVGEHDNGGPMFQSEISAFVAEHALADDVRSALAELLKGLVTNPTTGGETFFLDEEEVQVVGPTSAANQRYADDEVIGIGGMAQVRRVRDKELDRCVAMKIIKTELLQSPGAVARFMAEARITAMLQHPSIVPVYDIGQLPDGRLYFTMKEVKGRTFTSVIREVHGASPVDSWEASAQGWTFRRLIDAVHKCASAMGFAHSQETVHRDLKPENVMVGEFGEVLVVDWGLARRLESHGRTAAQIAGTPAYMPPEQARGQGVDARSDVYSLGAILFEVLAGYPPFEGGDHTTIMKKVIQGPPRDLPQNRPLPDDLVAIWQKAMSREPEDRYDHAGEMAAALIDWLDGARKRALALEIVERATTLTPEIEELREQASYMREEAHETLALVEPWEGEEQKAPGWQLQDEAAKLENMASVKELEAGRLFHAAFTHCPELPEAHAALAERYRSQHMRAEQDRAHERAMAMEQLLRQHADALPDAHPSRVAHHAYLRGHGALTLVTDPPGADVLVHRYQTHHRRLVPVFVRRLGPTPFERVTLPMGSYLMVIRREGHSEVRYPVHIGRQEHWDGAPPTGRDPHVIRLPREGELGVRDCYVPGGWFIAGGDPDASESLARQRLWCDPFIIRRYPATVKSYLAFLNDLVRSGRPDEAEHWALRGRAHTKGSTGAPLLARNEKGRYGLRPGADGALWGQSWPVLMVDYNCAAAYCRWYAARKEQPWRLPLELEWEKAARGVDGRFYPWGDVLDPAWTLMRDSHQGRPTPSPVDSWPVDESVYGVRGLGGNTRDWCEDMFVKEREDLQDRRVHVATRALGRGGKAQHVTRGGHFLGGMRQARCSGRYATATGLRSNQVSFRMVRGLA